jgi:hypothetical protein
MKTSSKLPKWFKPKPEWDTPRFLLGDTARLVSRPGLVKVWVSRGVIRLGTMIGKAAGRETAASSPFGVCSVSQRLSS